MSTQHPISKNPTTLGIEKVRNEIKSKFDAKPFNDPMYLMYNTIDNNIPKNDSTKNDILRITQFFNTLSFFTSVHDFLDDAYLNYNNLRRGFLTNGALFKTTEKKGQLSVTENYNCDELHQLSKDNSKKYQEILTEIDIQLKAIEPSAVCDKCNHTKKWLFWPGSEMKIPHGTTILVDTSVDKSKFVLTKKEKPTSNEATQIVLEEKSYQLEISSLGDNELYYDDSDDKNAENQRKLESGFFSINKSGPQFKDDDSNGFYEIELALKNGQEYDYTLYVPYDTARYDIKTDMKIFGEKGEIVDEFIATCS